MKLLLAMLFLLLPAPSWSQRKVDPRHSYQRLICVVPMTGAGTAADPRRPLYAPAALTPGQPGILAYSHQISDDGRYALVEFVALDREAFAPILADRSVKAFFKSDAAYFGRHLHGVLTGESGCEYERRGRGDLPGAGDA